MIVIPAIDIRKGRCVRLLQGRMDQETVFSDDPAAMAIRWAGHGAQMLHVVDLDGAVEKTPCNLDSIRSILRSVEVPVQVGGGIRSLDVIAMYAELGVKRLVIGTEAIRNPKMVKEACRRFPGKIVVGIDAKDGKVVCFFQSAQKFKARYATLGFNDSAKLDEGAMWPTAYALKELTPAEEERIAALVKKAVR